MNCVINEHLVLSQAPEGPLSVYIQPFADFLSSQGYARYSIHRPVYLVACFSRWLAQQGIELPQLSADHRHQYLQERAGRRKPARGDGAALGHMIDFLHCEGGLAIEPKTEPEPTPAQHCTQTYEQHPSPGPSVPNAVMSF